MIINVAKRHTEVITLYEHSADGPRNELGYPPRVTYLAVMYSGKDLSIQKVY